MISVEQKHASKEEIARTLWLISFFRPGVPAEELASQAEINHPGQRTDIRNVLWAMVATEGLRVDKDRRIYVDNLI